MDTFCLNFSLSTFICLHGFYHIIIRISTTKKDEEEEPFFLYLPPSLHNQPSAIDVWVIETVYNWLTVYPLHPYQSRLYYNLLYYRFWMNGWMNKWEEICYSMCSQNRLFYPPLKLLHSVFSKVFYNSMMTIKSSF